MAAVTICSDFGAQKVKSVTVSIVSPSICHEVMGPDAMILVHCLLVQLKHTDRNGHSNLMARLRGSVVTAIP